MKIFGIEKFSLVDYDGNSSCVLFTDKCNFRCPYCHNADLVLGKVKQLDVNEVFSYLDKRKNILDAVVISGGEPTLDSQLIPFVSELKQKFLYKIKLDTNGSNYKVLEKLIEDKLVDYVAMDIKNQLSKYSQTIGIHNFDTTQVEQSIQLLLQNNVDYEFRTTLVSELHTENDIREMAKLISGAKRYYLQKFVDSGNCLQQKLNAVDISLAEKYLHIAKQYVQVAELRSY